MSHPSPPLDDAEGRGLLDRIADETGAPSSFGLVFRGYDREEVDTVLATLRQRVAAAEEEARVAHQAHLDDRERHRDEDEILIAKHEHRAAQLEARTAEVEARAAEIEAHAAEVEAHAAELEIASARAATRVAELEADLIAASARAHDAEQQVETLTADIVEGRVDRPDGPTDSRLQFEAVLRVAEEQANVLIQNAAIQAERLLDAAREEVTLQRATLDADVARITTQAQQEADQARLRIETERTAHEVQIERARALADEAVAQAEREAAVIRAEAEKAAASLRGMAAREVAQLRADAERDVREMNTRVLEFEESLTRRQDEAQQEFLVLHNQAVSHAERLTSDANDQVAASLEHAQRIAARADDYERLMRAQAKEIEAAATVRARETLDRARSKAQKISDTVIAHTTGMLRDAEDRTRQLRWQQQQLTSVMAEVRELIRPESPLRLEGSGSDDATVADLAPVADTAPEAEDRGERAETDDAVEAAEVTAED